MRLFTVLCAVAVFLIQPAYASPKYAAVKREAENIKKAERKLAKKIARLSAADRQRLKTKFSGADSDADGVADIIEGALGSNRCDTDSDDDGFDDSDDYREDTPGSNDDSPDYDEGDDDSSNPGDDSPGSGGGTPTPGVTPTPGSGPVEFEVKGTVTSYDDPIVVIRGARYKIGPDTKFVGKGFGKEDIAPGICLEVKGRQTGPERLLTRVKEDDDC